MPTAVIMPKQGQSVESCIICKWHKKKGDKVSPGDILFSYETDKSTFDEEAKTEGMILEIFYNEGDEVECFKAVCVIGIEGENIDEFRPDKQSAAIAGSAMNAVYPSDNVDSYPDDQELQAENSGSASIPPTSKPAETEILHISPRARVLADKTGADVSRAVPTGANNRIMEKDIQNVIAGGYLATRAVKGEFSHVTGTGIGGRVTTADIEKWETDPHEQAVQRPDFEKVKLAGVRKVIAETMRSSLYNSAQLTLHSSFDATDIFSFRAGLKAVAADPDAAKITVTDIITYAVSRTLLNHRYINAQLLDDTIALYNNAHIGVAVDTPRGLLVPTIFNANMLSLAEISLRAKVLFDKCKQGGIEPDALKGGTFTISNLGGLGIEMFTPILNPPQTGLLGVCSVVERTRDGKVYPAIGLSLTFDHRALDGADAARFLRDLVQYLEKFSICLAFDNGSLSTRS